MPRPIELRGKTVNIRMAELEFISRKIIVFGMKILVDQSYPMNSFIDK